MRIGQNPAKSLEQVDQPPRVMVAIINYIPELSGYFADSLNVLKVSLQSLWQHTDCPYELLIFDNGSCTEVRRFLLEAHEQGKIHYLLFSENNIGKSAAWNIIFGSARCDLLAYADNDIFYYPGWLKALMKVIDEVPQVGMVSGMPLLNPEQFSTQTIAWAQNHTTAMLDRGRLLAWEDYWRHAGRLGNDELKARAFYEEHDSLRLTYQGHTYYIGAGHFQFLARCEVLQKVIPLPADRPMGQVRALDAAVNELGYLRLCTSQWWVEHIGNTLEERFIEALGKGKEVLIPKASKKKGSSIWRWRPLRKLLAKLNDKTFQLLNT